MTDIANSPVLDFSVSGSGAALNATPIAATDAIEYAIVAVQLTGTFTGTYAFETSLNGTDWFSAPGSELASISGAPVISGTLTPKIYVIPLNSRYFRVRISAYTSGTLNAFAFFQASFGGLIQTLTAVDAASGITGVSVPAYASFMGGSSGGNLVGLSSTAGGAFYSNLRDNSGNELIGRKLPTLALPIVPCEAPTYGAASAFSAPANPTDVFTLTGSATKIVRVKRIYIGVSATNPLTFTFSFVKRSTANTGGTSSTLTAVPFDSADSAATAVARSYTANPTLGTSVGTLGNVRISVPQNVPLGGVSNGPIDSIDFHLPNAMPVVLRGTGEVLAVNMGATTLAGNNLAMSIVWTEEDT